jgi:hypothetical protein
MVQALGGIETVAGPPSPDEGETPVVVPDWTEASSAV